MIAKAFCFPSSGLGPFHLGIPSAFPSVLRTPPPHMTCVLPQLGLPLLVTAFCSYLTPKCPVSSGLRWLAPFCSWLSAQLGVHVTISEPRLLFLSGVPADTTPVKRSCFFNPTISDTWKHAMELCLVAKEESFPISFMSLLFHLQCTVVHHRRCESWVQRASKIACSFTLVKHIPSSVSLLGKKSICLSSPTVWGQSTYTNNSSASGIIINSASCTCHSFPNSVKQQ